MNIYIDESIHDKYGFMLLGYVTCQHDPQHDLAVILKKYDLDEFHAGKKMKNDHAMQQLRSDIRSYLNSYCEWGVLVLPSNMRTQIKEDLINLVECLSKVISKFPLNIFIDEGIISDNDAKEIVNLKRIKNLEVCSSHEVNGIQLADLVAALCGVRLREEISGEPKMLTYGDDYGFNPPIEAELGYELWASLRYSMLRNSKSKGDDVPELLSFDTAGYGFFTSQACSTKLKEKAKNIFGELYLGCIH